MYLGPVVALQQVLDVCPQNCHPQEKERYLTVSVSY